MKDNWSDYEYATDWDTDAAVTNFSRSMLLDLLTSIITDTYIENNKILDLGFGSGHVEDQLLSKLPEAQIVGVDASDVMIAKAKERLKDNSNVIMINHDLNRINSLILPKGNYQFAITSFVLHEIPSVHKREIFEFIYKTLMPGGLYILVDRFKIDSDALILPYTSQWSWKRKFYKGKGTKPFEEYKKEISAKEDSPNTMEEQLIWLRETGFKSACLQLLLDRGLIVGVKT